MKAEIGFTDLQRYLRVLSAVAATGIKSRYAPPPVVGIDVDGQTVTLSAATWQITGQLTLGGGMSDGSAAVQTAHLSAAINAIAPPRTRRTTTVTLAGVPGHLHVSGAATVTLGADTDWTGPQLPQPQQHVVRMPVRDWTNTVTAVMRAIDKRDARHVHGGLRLYREPGCCLVVEATDRMRIHRQVIGDPQPGPHESRLAVTPAKLLLRLLALAGDTDEITIGYGDDTLLAVSGPVTVAAKAPAWDGWPDVQIVLEHSIEHGAAFTVNSHAMGEALRAARAVADPANPHIDLDLDPASQQISLLVPGRDRPLLTRLVAVKQVRGPRQKFGLRADHASDVFTAITATNTTLTVPSGHNLLGVTAGRFHAALIRYTR